MFRTFGSAAGPVVVLGHKMILASSNTYPPIAMAAGQYEPETTRLLERIVEPGMSIIDVGAHVGYYSLIAARAVGPTGKVYSFEAEPANYGLLVENARLNGYENVVAINKGVSNAEGTATLFVSGLDNGRNSLFRHDLPQAGTRTIETISLDGFLEGLDWPDIDLVKVDVEGSEDMVWEGMALLRQKSPNLKLIIELNPALLRGAGVEPFEFLDKAMQSGFNIQWIDEGTGVVSIESIDLKTMLSRLEAEEESVNLFCVKA